jgi:hypothetical protein
MLPIAKIVLCLWQMNEMWMCNITGMILTEEKSKYLGKILSNCHFIHLKSHMDWLGSKIGSLDSLWLKCDCLIYY